MKCWITNKTIPRIIPIVIYTGQREWKAKRTVEEIQVEFEHLKGIDVITGYNLVDIRDEKEAIEEGTAVARMSVIERMKDTEEIIEVVKKMSKHIKEKEERKEPEKEEEQQEKKLNMIFSLIWKHKKILFLIIHMKQ